MKRAIAFTVAVVLKSAWLAVVIWAWPSESARTTPVARPAQAATALDARGTDAVVFVGPGPAR